MGSRESQNRALQILRNAQRDPLCKGSILSAGVKASVKEAAMKKLYGPNITSAEVLSGAVPQQPVVEPLVAELQMMQRQGALQDTAPTGNHF